MATNALVKRKWTSAISSQYTSVWENDRCIETKYRQILLIRDVARQLTNHANGDAPQGPIGLKAPKFICVSLTIKIVRDVDLCTFHLSLFPQYIP
jgi:hypothetical protein